MDGVGELLCNVVPGLDIITMFLFEAMLLYTVLWTFSNSNELCLEFR